MHRFYTPSKNISGDRIIISDNKVAHHIRDVLRLETRDKVIVFDEQGNEYDCIINQVLNEVRLDIINKHLSYSKAKSISITIACAIPKKSKIEDIIDKLTQLGVDRIIPLKTERVVVKIDKHKEMLRLSRWKKIAQVASEQSHRNNIPLIDRVRDIKEVILNSESFDLKLIPTLIGRRKSLKEIFLNFGYKNILVLIGPEGDFSSQEVELAEKSGFIPISLGQLVLRVETAAVAVASCIRILLQ